MDDEDAETDALVPSVVIHGTREHSLCATVNPLASPTAQATLRSNGRGLRATIGTKEMMQPCLKAISLAGHCGTRSWWDARTSVGLPVGGVPQHGQPNSGRLVRVGLAEQRVTALVSPQRQTPHTKESVCHSVWSSHSTRVSHRVELLAWCPLELVHKSCVYHAQHGIRNVCGHLQL